ncbi:aminotransferase class V-fold PLP-dependent enzyme [Streptomyces sp. B21-106]
MRPLSVGGGMVDWVDLDGSVDRRTPFKFEAGTPAIASAIGSGAAIRYWSPWTHRRCGAANANSPRPWSAGRSPAPACV